MSEFNDALLAAQGAKDAQAEAVLIRQIAPPVRPLPLDHPMWFWTKIGFGATDCWYWTASISRLGYGAHCRTRGETKAHRFAYRFLKGPIPDGLHVLHRCDVRSCVNPDHLWLGTHQENMRDMAHKGRGGRGCSAGEANGMARLTAAEVGEIRALVATGRSQRSVSKDFAVSPMTISRIIRGVAWR